jgi:hypothetical protein
MEKKVFKFPKKSDTEIKLDSTSKKRNRNRKILENKKEDYKLSLDKRQLKDDQKIDHIDKQNTYKIREVKAKCNMSILALKAGYTLGKMCIILTLISCLLTLGGNIDNFICNIPLLKGENKEDFLFTWRKVLKTTAVGDNVSQDTIQILRFNVVTTLIYIPFLIGIQSILYQVSLCMYIIKCKFRAYYKYAVVLQFSMLFYSVYSNYMFISYYVRPDTLMEKIMCFIPSFLLDLASIFFLSLSMRMKTLNYDSNEIDKQDNLLLKGLRHLSNKNVAKSGNESSKKDNDKVAKSGNKKDEKFDEKNEKNIAQKSEKNIAKKGDNQKFESLENPGEDKANTAINFNEISLKKNEKNIAQNIAKKGNEKGDKKYKKNTGKLTKISDNASNKNLEKSYQKVIKYIYRLKEKNIDKVHVGTLLSKLKISKNIWHIIRDRLISEGILSFNGRVTRIL